MKKLVCTNKKVSDLSSRDIFHMHRLFTEYYHNVDFSQFEKDLLEKDRVFLLKDKRSRAIKGFSTIVELSAMSGNTKVRSFFSGDTVVDKEYWGQGTLGVAFLGFLFKEKLKRPFTPLYWYLISKGYKTYLLMANNFKTHYPRFERQTPPDMQELIDQFSMELYGDYYQSGVISFSQHKAVTKDCLKSGITPITDEMILKNKRIEYFAKRNPGWEQGDELACIARMTLSMPFYYQMKLVKKQIKKIFYRREKRFVPAESI